jgi:hypothetical protein
VQFDAFRLQHLGEALDVAFELRDVLRNLSKLYVGAQSLGIDRGNFCECG